MPLSIVKRHTDKLRRGESVGPLRAFIAGRSYVIARDFRIEEL